MRLKSFILTVLLVLAQKLSAQQTDVLYLSGHDADDSVTWRFYCSAGQNSGKWGSISIPSCWEQQGYGEYTYGRYYKKKDGKASTETGLYRRSFKVPVAWQGRKVELVFDGVMTDATVKVNGQLAGPTHKGGFTSFSYNVSALLYYGKKNNIEVFVKKQSDDKTVNSAERMADWWLFGGIYRPVYLRALPAVNIERIALDARADGSMTLELHTQGLASDYRLSMSVEGVGTRTSSLGTHSVSLKNVDEQVLTASWNGVKTWDTEHPNLYLLRLKLISPAGNVLHEVTQRFGFRTVEFRRRDGFYLNGTRLLVKGVNRHCFYPETGRTTSRVNDLNDVKIVKGMNANAIRSHYPPDEHLLDICDSLGVLYLPELPGWQNHYSTEIGGKILHEMLIREVNHPCIFAWSNGNEGGFNYDLDAMFAKYDLQKRHVVHPWALFDGVDTHHYPSYQTGVARLGNGYNVFMPTEFLHAQYDKGAGTSLDDFWNNWLRNPRFAGGFIWALLDEGVMRTDRNGEIDTDGTNGPDGVVGPHREKEASWFTVRDVWSPLQIFPMVVSPSWNGVLRIANGSLFSRLDEFSMSYKVLSLSSPVAAVEQKTLCSGAIRLPSTPAGEVGTAQINLPDTAKLGDLLRIVALNADGDTVNVWSFPIKYADEYFAGQVKNLRIAGKATVSGNTLAASGVRVEFSRETGNLMSVNVNGKDVPFNNGPLPVGMKMRLKTVKQQIDGSDALLIMHYAGAVDSIVWRMRPDGVLGMDAVMLNDRQGHGFEGSFFDEFPKNFGFTFSYPEQNVRAMTWLGRGPYRVWRNRQRGQNLGIWRKTYNNTITGESAGLLTYPEFKGYHANVYWASIESDTAPFTVYSETDGLYLRVFTPEEPHALAAGTTTMQDFPAGDISFLLEIPAMRSYKTVEQMGPQAQQSHIRLNPGDEGLRLKLWFDFKR